MSHLFAGLSTSTPLANGTAAVGTSQLASRQDHIHPLSTAACVTSYDTRAVTTTPETTAFPQVRYDFKQNTTESLSDGGTYFGEMTFRPYGNTTDWTGGGAYQLGFTNNSNLWIRYGTSTTWGSWKRFLTTDDKAPASVTKEETGFTDPANVTVTYDSVNRTVTLTGTVVAYYQGKIVSVLTSGWVSSAHSNTNGVWYLFYNGSTFVWQQTPWSFDMLQIAFVNFGTSDKFCIRETHGLMPWQSHKLAHETTGTYRNSGGVLSSYVVDSFTAANRRPAVSAAVVSDEDLQTTVTALSAGSYSLMTLTGSGTSVFTLAAAEIIPVSGSVPYYNQLTATWGQTLLGGNQYTAVWLYALPVSSDAVSQAYRYVWIQGQQTTTDLATANGWSVNDLNLGTLSTLSPEFVAVAKVLIKTNAPGNDWSITSVTNLTQTKVGATTGLASTNADTLDGQHADFFIAMAIALG